MTEYDDPVKDKFADMIEADETTAILVGRGNDYEEALEDALTDAPNWVDEEMQDYIDTNEAGNSIDVYDGRVDVEEGGEQLVVLEYELEPEEPQEETDTDAASRGSPGAVASDYLEEGQGGPVDPL
jgi:hypothetical protein